MKLKNILLSTLFLLFSFSIVYGEETKLSDILGQNVEETSTAELEEKEIEREENFLNQLLLKIPLQTDNPNHTITFIDPSEDKKGIQLEIDGKSFQSIKSPYSLPSLSIGKHILRFKFVDKYGATQILERELIVVPRPPIVNSPTQSENGLKISGTGLANSELILILSSSSNILTKTTTISAEGNWEITITDELVAGIYTFTGYTRRYGYAGDLAEPVTLEYGGYSNTKNENNGNKKDIHFAFKDIPVNSIGKVLVNNPDLILLLITTFLAGVLTATFVGNLLKKKNEEVVIKSFKKQIDPKPQDSLTILEKLNGKGKKVEAKEEAKPEEKIVTKIDFLKDYKKFDPDTEAKEEPENKTPKIKISLTSKD